MNRADHCRAMTIALCAALAATVAAAQDDTALDGVPWMQAEIIVFRQMDTSSAGDEQWPAHPQLAYPATIEILRDPTALLDTAAPATQSLPGTPASAVPVAAAPPGATPATSGAAIPTPAPQEQPFLLLGRENFLLADAAARLTSSAGYRVLTHVAWRQPLPRANAASNILVTGGDPHESHFELEGYVTLRREHFLHLDTNLWLHDFAAAGANLQGTDGGADLPALPRLPEPVAPLLDPQTGTATLPDAAAASVANAGTATGDTAATVSADAAAVAATGMPEEQAVEPPPVHTLRSVVLRATRRTRLGEIHYIDHPLFGVIVSLRAYDPEAAATPAVDGAVPGAPAASALPTASTP